MKRKALIAVVLLTVVALLAGCGGVSQEEFDTAVADKDAAIAAKDAALAQVTSLNTQLTQAKADLVTAKAEKAQLAADKASLTTTKTTLETKITTLEAKIVSLQAEIAELEAGGGGEEEPPAGGGGTQPPAPAYTGTKYTDSAHGFSVLIPDGWTEATTLPAGCIKKVSNAGTGPSLLIIVMPKAGNADVKAAFTAYLLGDTNKVLNTFTKTTVTLGGVSCDRGPVVYTGSYGEYNGEIIGFAQGDNWVIIGALTLPSYYAWTTPTAAQIIDSVTIP